VADMQETLLGLFTEVAIVEHLSRTRFQSRFGDELEVGHFGILNYFLRTNRPPDSVAGIAFAFQVDEDIISKRVEQLRTLGYVSVTAALRPADAVVDVTKEGRAARDEQISRMRPQILEIVSEIPVEDLKITVQTLREIRLVLDNLPDR
jgi:DNA-binding MarR family transcriptional regulator